MLEVFAGTCALAKACAEVGVAAGCDTKADPEAKSTFFADSFLNRPNPGARTLAVAAA